VATSHDVIYQEVKAPLMFALEQNFPNPFNPSTNIKYNIPVESAVELRIFNILGQEVITLVDEITKAGFYNVEWDGKDNFNHRVASGIYIYSFLVKSVDGQKSFKQVRKMLLMK
jgi:flagellar hook assembly protein FlgD